MLRQGQLILAEEKGLALLKSQLKLQPRTSVYC